MNALNSARVEVILCLEEIRGGEVNENFRSLVEILHAKHRQKCGIILLVKSVNFTNDGNTVPE